MEPIKKENNLRQKLYKILVLGADGVGKTQMLNQYLNNKFKEQYKATIGADFFTKQIDYQGNLLTLQIWDTAGQEKFQSLGTAFYRGSDGLVLVYDINDQKSADRLKGLIQEFKIHTKNFQDFPVVIIGNKSDLCQGQKYYPDIEKELEKDIKIKDSQLFFEHSAKEGSKEFEEAIQLLVEQMIYNSKKNEDDQILQSSLLQNQSQEQDKPYQKRQRMTIIEKRCQIF